MRKRVETQQLVVWLNVLRYPVEHVAALSGLKRQSIWKRLKRAGCHVPRRAKGGAPGVMMEVQCAFCGIPFLRRKRVIAQRQTMKSFCNRACYAASLSQSGYVEWRQGSRLARAIVAQHFRLAPEHIVHHKDGNQRNNDIKNLVVYASHADYMAVHRGRAKPVVFDGTTVQHRVQK